jgi:hypothetical protein
MLYGFKDMLYGFKDILYGLKDMMSGLIDMMYGLKDILYGLKDMSYGYKDNLYGACIIRSWFFSIYLPPKTSIKRSKTLSKPLQNITKIKLKH